MSDTASSLRDRILGAAFDAFMKLGYSGASTATIARMAHVSKRDLYALFGSKQAMLAACIKEGSERMERPLTLPAPRSREALMATLIEFGIGFLTELGRAEVLATHRLVIAESANDLELARTFDQLGRGNMATVMTTFLAAASEKGLLTGGDPAEMSEVFFGALMANSMLLRMILRVADPPGPAEARKRAENAVERLLRLYRART